MRNFLFILLLVVPFKAFAVQEIPEPSIQDIAITTILNGEVVILYNPNYCQQMGLLVCNFFRSHEYGHVNLGHPLLGTYPQQAEFEADCWAAQNAPLDQVLSAYQYFMNEGFMGDWSHGTGFQRAQRIAVCAQTRSGWLSNVEHMEPTGKDSTPLGGSTKKPSEKCPTPQTLALRARLVKLSAEIYFVGSKYSEKRQLLFKDKDPCKIAFYEQGYYPDSSPTFDLKRPVFFGKGIDFQSVPMSYSSARFVKEYLEENPLGSKYHHITKATTFLPETEHAYIPEIAISDVPLKYWALLPIVEEGKVEKASEFGQQDWLEFSSDKDRNRYFDLLLELQKACLAEEE